jgi:two-component system cell cycle response regulator
MNPLILLVDDNDEILDFLAADLGSKYAIAKATNGEQALQLLAREAVQLVVSDVMMPVMDGFELCRLIKSNFDYSHIPVILLTAKNTLQSKIEGLEMGADAYIEKPFSPEHLQVQISIQKNIDNPDLDVEQLARIMNMSRPTLYRKINAISNLSPNELINITRLKRAAELMAEGAHKLYEIAELVGYSSQNNFGRNFLKQFGITPSDYVSIIKKDHSSD